jgi:hypothetical protein
MDSSHALCTLATLMLHLVVRSNNNQSKYNLLFAVFLTTLARPTTKHYHSIQLILLYCTKILVKVVA